MLQSSCARCRETASSWVPATAFLKHGSAERGSHGMLPAHSRNFAQVYGIDCILPQMMPAGCAAWSRASSFDLTVLYSRSHQNDSLSIWCSGHDTCCSQACSCRETARSSGPATAFLKHGSAGRGSHGMLPGHCRSFDQVYGIYCKLPQMLPADCAAWSRASSFDLTVLYSRSHQNDSLSIWCSGHDTCCR